MTERRVIASVPHPPSMPADSSRDVAQEDFLFHLYRGSELLQENRVFEAKEELEVALTAQPLDPKGQDLLGAVYFRLGLYPRAIQIYENLAAQFPGDASIKINLALCYLKTGQPEPARRALQDAVRIHPEHKRAWGYLGLALQKTGDTEGAQIAFERGGHPMMARRMTEKEELDAGELRLALAEPGASRQSDAPWPALEAGGTAKSRPPPAKTKPPPSVRDRATGSPYERELASAYEKAPPSVHEVLTIAPPLLALAPKATTAAAVPSLFTLPPDECIALHETGALLVRTTDEQAFAGRLDALRLVAGAASTRVLHRRARDADTGEVLGGLGSPLVRIAGAANVVLGPRPTFTLQLLALEDERAFVREELLFGFELRLQYENGRLSLDPPAEGPRPTLDGAPIVQLRGSGTLVIELPGTLAAVSCTAGRPLLVRREWVVGWLGRLMPRALPPGESPIGQRGLLGFSGDGTVLVCAS